MKLKIAILVIATILFSLVMFLQNDSFFMAQGSDVLDVVIVPSLFSSIASLILFVFSGVLLIALRAFRAITVPLMVVSVVIISMNCHTFTVSARENQIMDRWFFLTIQSLAFNPNEGLSEFKTKTAPVWISIEAENKGIITVVTNIRFVGLREERIVAMLERFGANEAM